GRIAPHRDLVQAGAGRIQPSGRGGGLVPLPLQLGNPGRQPAARLFQGRYLVRRLPGCFLMGRPLGLLGRQAAFPARHVLARPPGVPPPAPPPPPPPPPPRGRASGPARARGRGPSGARRPGAGAAPPPAGGASGGRTGSPRRAAPSAAARRSCSARVPSCPRR